MTDTGENKNAAKATNPNKVGEMTSAENEYRNEVVMESGGTINPDSTNYTESDDEMNAIAEGWK